MAKYVPKGFTRLDEVHKIICGKEGELIHKDIPFTADEKYFHDLMQERIDIINQSKAMSSPAVIPPRLADIDEELEQNASIVELVENKNEMQIEILDSCNYEIYMLGILNRASTWLVTDKKELISSTSLFKKATDFSQLFLNNVDIVINDPNEGKVLKNGYLVINKKAIDASKQDITNELVKIYEQGLIDFDELFAAGSNSQMPNFTDDLGKAIAHVHIEYKRMNSEAPKMRDNSIFSLIKEAPFEIYPKLNNWSDSVFRQIKSGKFNGSINRNIGPISLK